MTSNMKVAFFAFDIFSPSDIAGFVHTIAGLLAPAGDLNDFIEKFEYLINNKNERQRLGNDAREKALKEYDWQKRAEETVNIYQKVL